MVKGLTAKKKEVIFASPIADGKMKPKETQVASAQSQVLRAQKNCKQCESLKAPKGAKCTHVKSKEAKRAHGEMNFLGRFKENNGGGAGHPGRKFEVTLLQEGLGNFEDAFYYTKEAIESAVPLFEGRHFFIDHPDQIEEKTRPERSVRDLAGYFEQVSAVEDENGVTALKADLIIFSDPSLDLYRIQMMESIAYAARHEGEDLVGLSINAGGDFDQSPIDQFIQSPGIPAVCQEKLLEAMKRGVRVIRPVREMKSAVSCDLVTVAGAGGKINQLLEGGKKMKMHEEMESKESEESKVKEDGMEQDMGDDADGQSGEHQDAAQDEELIKKILQKYLGDGFTDGDKMSAKEAYEHAKGMGMEEKEAQAVAGFHAKKARMGQAQPQEGVSQEAGLEGVEKVHGEKTVPAADAKNGMKKSDQVQESAKGKKEEINVVEIMAKNARLEQELGQLRLKEYTDKALRESKLPMHATKKFRECIKDAKSAKEVEEKLNLFKEAFRIGGEAENDGFIIGLEKQPSVSPGSMSFADCLE